ncbi:MAG: MFS transporter [Gammaproteobacteria bacterium]|jgi:predicted MFS family arabinose efflux permease|nr:MFS transporter [Gammaproteobacteria bacterium]
MNTESATTADTVPQRADEDGNTQRSWYALGILTLVYATHYLDRTVLALVIEPLRQEFRLTDIELGMLTGLAYGATFALAGIPMGLLIDRGNRVRLLAAMAATWSAMTAAFGLAQGYAHLILARIGLSASQAGGSPCSLSLISDLFPPHRRATAIGIFFLSSGIGALLIILAGTVAARFGWRTAMIAAGMPGIVLALILLLTVREPRRGATDPAAASTEKPPRLGQVLRAIRQSKALIHLIVGFSFTAGGIAAVSSWFGAFVMRFHNLEMAQVGIAIALAVGIAGAFGSSIGGAVSDTLSKTNPRRRLDVGAVSCVLAAGFAASALTAGTPVLAIGLLALSNVFAFAVFPSVFSTMLSLAGNNMRGTVAASSQVCSNLVGYGMGPFMVGLLSDQIGGEQSLRYAMLTVTSVLFPLAALHLVLSARHVRR